MVKEEKSSQSHIDDSLEVLVWPKVIEPRARRKKLEEKGWVLGWKVPETNDSNDARLSIWLCAGILDTSQSLAEYEKRVKVLQENAAILHSRESSLVDDLQILARWRRAQTDNRPSSKTAKSKGRPTGASDSKIDDSTDGGLPVISNERNYPWIKIDKDENDDVSVQSDATNPASNSTTRDKKPKRKAPSQTLASQQLLYYSVYPDNPLAHLATELENSNFSALLDLINHSQEIFQMVQTGNIPKETKIERPQSDEKTVRWRGNKQSEDGVSKSSHEEIVDETKDDGHIPRQLSRFIFAQSMVLQHFHQMTSPSHSVLATMPAFRCWQARREISKFFSRPTSANKLNDHPTSLVPWKSQHVQTHVSHCNGWTSSLLDMMLGFLACLVLLAVFQFTPSPAGLYHISLKKSIFEFLHKGVDWLETFPAGFKLNVKITSNVGYQIRSLLRWHQELLKATVWNLAFNRDWLFPVLSGIALCFGWTGLMAVVIDLMRLEVLHTLLLAKSFRILYQAELYLLASLWRLFRGKKRNRLRQRTDSMQYDSTQLLVGTIGFCICIFLWTTILVYYTFFMLWNLALQLPILGLWLLYIVARSLPLASLWFRSTKINWFTENLYTQVLLEEEDHFTIARLVGLNQPHASILQGALQPQMKRLSGWLVSSIVELLKPRSSDQIHCAFPLSTLFEVKYQ